MKTSIKGLAFIASLEGLCQSKYKDSVGVWTIGVGATKSEIPDLATWPMDKKLSIQEVFELFQKSIVKYENAINKALKVGVTQNQFDALVSVCYNIGTGGASGSTFMKRINNHSPVGRIMSFSGGSFDEVWNETWRTDSSISYEEGQCLGFSGGGTITDAILMWNKPKEIIGRRTKEAKLYSEGKYGDGKVNVFPVNSNGVPLYAKGKIINVNDYLT